MMCDFHFFPGCPFCRSDIKGIEYIVIDPFNKKTLSTPACMDMKAPFSGHGLINTTSMPPEPTAPFETLHRISPPPPNDQCASRNMPSHNVAEVFDSEPVLPRRTSPPLGEKIPPRNPKSELPAIPLCRVCIFCFRFICTHFNLLNSNPERMIKNLKIFLKHNPKIYF